MVAPLRLWNGWLGRRRSSKLIGFDSFQKKLSNLLIPLDNFPIKMMVRLQYRLPLRSRFILSVMYSTKV
jgi:hypothetical protein